MDVLGEQSEVEFTEDDLDIEFRQILCLIKQYIPRINSNYQLSLYRLWLEKLSCSNSEKKVRNLYLLELARQIKDNKIYLPFTEPPPLGSLKSLPKIPNGCPSYQPQIPHRPEVWPFSQEPDPLSELTPDFQPSCCFQNQAHSPRKVYFRTPEVQGIFDGQSYPPLVEQNNNYEYDPNYDDDDEASDAFSDSPKTCQRTRKRRSKILRSAQKVGQKDYGPYAKTKDDTPSVEEDKPQRDVQRDTKERRPITPNEESSWCDLTTDASVTSVVVQTQDAANSVTTPYDTSCENIRKQVDSRGDKINSPLTDDTCSKKHKEQSAKSAAKERNFISEDWKKTIEGLQLRLTETLNQNNELKALINSLQVKLKEELKKNKDHKDTKERKADLHTKEIETLRKIQLDNIRNLEKSFQVKLDEAERKYQEKIKSVREEYEKKIRDLKFDHENSKKEKDQEIGRLSEIIQQQCVRMSEEIAGLRRQMENSAPEGYNGNDEKITVLQKCVTKMDKLFQKSEKEYMKQIEKLQQELQLKDRVTEIQLKTQRAELISRASAEKQKQFDKVVNSLEVKYIRMLEYHETEVMESRRLDEEKMEKLKQLLDKNDIPIPFDCD